MIRKWLHNKKLKHNPMCPCGWRMIDHPHRHFSEEDAWKCKFDDCTWEAFETPGGRIKYWYE